MAEPIIEDIKSRIDIVDVIGQYINLKKSGANYKGLCPFHGEKTPSFMVNRERQMFRCFGCGESGDAFSFLMKQESIDFPHALELLAAKAGVVLPEHEKSQYRSQSTSNKRTLYSVNDVASRFFHQVLTTHPAGAEALAYLKKRGVNNESIVVFNLGYAPANSQPINAVLSKQNFAAPVIRQAGSPERFRDRIMFPFRTVIGQVVGFSGRALHDAQPKYLNTSDTDLFHKNRFLYGLFEAKRAIVEAKKIILVEGQLDLVMAHQAGTKYAVATSGTALTDEHLRILRRYADILILAFDGDNAGQKATERAIQLALPHGFDVSVVKIPEGSDPGELACDATAWLASIDQAETAISWLFRHFFPAAENMPTASERGKIFDVLFPYIEKLDDVVERGKILRQLGVFIGVTQEKVILEAYEKWRQKRPTSTTAPTVLPTLSTIDIADDDVKKHERELIGLLLAEPGLLADSSLVLDDTDFVLSGYAKIYKIIKNWYNKHTEQSANQLIASVQATLPPQAASALDKLNFDIQTKYAEFTPEQKIQEYTYLVKLVRSQKREDRIQAFAQRIAEAEQSHDRVKVIELIKEMQSALNEEAHGQENSQDN